jgi:hypothetical protein
MEVNRIGPMGDHEIAEFSLRRPSNLSGSNIDAAVLLGDVVMESSWP